ncbi:hypothetical protein NDU88_004961 [Pleurodeles waltl]|uniref:Uncharacterized protein n=1 Tax=Pleurodeles waltl TaxID=8319 RepID=A0AAV7LB13_PLEWA|nr:hypothetical protein NDU88_004961 [Pleurodeles waltl]
MNRGSRSTLGSAQRSRALSPVLRCISGPAPQGKLPLQGMSFFPARVQAPVSSGPPTSSSAPRLRGSAGSDTLLQGRAGVLLGSSGSSDESFPGPSLRVVPSVGRIVSGARSACADFGRHVGRGVDFIVSGHWGAAASNFTVSLAAFNSTPSGATGSPR